MLIYKATNKVNGKSYIGQTINTLHHRRVQHFAETNQNRYVSYFHNAIRKYGRESFEWDVVCECESIEELNDTEIHYIALSGDYNLTEGGDGARGYVMSDDYKKKLSKRMSENNPMFNTDVINRMKKSKQENGYYQSQKFKDACKKQSETMSREWIITTPDGDEILISNLNKYCRDNNLHCSCMVNVANGSRKQHKGYKCRRNSNESL